MHFKLGKCIARAAQNLDRRIVVIASGDLSHCLMDTGPYGYACQNYEISMAGAVEMPGQCAAAGGAFAAPEQLPAGGACVAPEQSPAGGAFAAPEQLPAGGACVAPEQSPAGGAFAAPEQSPSDAVIMTPKQLVDRAKALAARGNIGLAYTYNEPLIGYEFVRDCAILAHNRGLKNVVVTNGSLSVDILDTLLPYICRTAERSHVEVTTLIIPGENDTVAEMEALSGWLASISHWGIAYSEYMLSNC